jgi:NAD(P)-dependent dehydrogenase (short-subunit alcohol dehydrogenase family)
VPRFLLSYRVPRDYQPGAETAKAWQAWFHGLGASHIDPGHAVLVTRALGNLGDDTRLGGYSLVTAEDIDGAVALATGGPALQLKGGVEIGAVPELSGNPPAATGDAAEVCALANAVLARSRPVHVLIHSAGGLLPAAARTREGADRGFAQNFLGAFLLTRLLEERLLASAPARVIAVGSAAHKLVKSADLDALIHPGTADPRMGSRHRGRYQMRSYQTAKLAATTWIYGLARRWAGRGVTANVLDPGIVKGKSAPAGSLPVAVCSDQTPTRCSLRCRARSGSTSAVTACWVPAPDCTGAASPSGRLNTSHSGIATQAAKNAAASGMFSQNQIISSPQRVGLFGFVMTSVPA